MSINANNVSGFFNSQLIGYFNQADQRFHKLSIFMIRWHKEYMQHTDHYLNDLRLTGIKNYIKCRNTLSKTMHVVSIYVLQLMLVTWMQHIEQMSRFDCVFIRKDPTVQSLIKDAGKLDRAI